MGKVANLSYWRKIVSWQILIMVELSLFLSACSAEIPARKILKDNGDSSPHEIRLEISDDKAVIDNGIVEVTLENPSGYLIGIKYNGMDNVLESKNRNGNKGYWDIHSDRYPLDKIETEELKVITQTDEVVELSFTKKWNSTIESDSTLPLNIDKRYIVRRSVPGVYMYGIFEREKDFPNARMQHIRIVFKLKEDKFRFMVLSDTRRRIMPSREDRNRSQELDFPEAVLLTNPSDPQLKGQVDDKYQYSSENKDNKLHGWISDEDAVGFWVITPSSEFRAGGPHKQGLTSHPGSTALSMFVTTHYAGDYLDTLYKKGEYWKKVHGPVFIYLNSASPEDDDFSKMLWNDAKRQLIEEIESWPYNFTASEDFPHAEQRGEVRGELQVRDGYISEDLMVAKSAFVGLAAPGDAGSWQYDGGQGYQFWTQADKIGRFNIKNVRPGEYNLYAWVPGFIGDYKFDSNITIVAGKNIDLGILVYEPPRNGPTLWEIGIPDRTAAEFFIPDPDPMFVNSLCLNDADKYRQYGLWDRYSDIYSDEDLVFTVDVSNYSQDWFFAQVPRTGYQETTWQIKFNLEDVNLAENYTLRLALAGASMATLQVRINRPYVRPVFSTSKLGRENMMARHAIHGLYRFYSIGVPGYTLLEGDNTIFLSLRHPGKFTVVMYDYIRLEGPRLESNR